MNDTESRIITFIVTITLGMFSIGRGIWMLKGSGKGWYFARLYSDFSYAQIPAGICFLWFALAAIFRSANVQHTLLSLGIVFGLLAVVVSFLRPSLSQTSLAQMVRTKPQQNHVGFDRRCSHDGA